MSGMDGFILSGMDGFILSKMKEIKICWNLWKKCQKLLRMEKLCSIWVKLSEKYFRYRKNQKRLEFQLKDCRSLKVMLRLEAQALIIYI